MVLYDMKAARTFVNSLTLETFFILSKTHSKD
jgi:hypothetical protein